MDNKGQFKKGHKGYWLDKKRGTSGMAGKKHSLTTKRKMSKAQIGRIITWGDKISKSKIGKPNFKLRGANNPLWKGGISKINKTIRQLIMETIEYKNWRREVFKRDNHICVFCGSKSGDGKAIILHADHIKPFALFPKLRFNIKNGRTLCIDCHKKSGTWGNLKSYV